MHRTTVLVALIVLSFLGIADAWYLASSALSDTALSCSITGLDGCNVVAQSAYSHLFGLPLALYGVAFYALIFVLAAGLLLVNMRRMYLGLVSVAGFGLLASLYFLFLQLFVIKALCIYCAGSVVIAVLVFLLSYWLWKRFTPPALAVVS